MKKLLGISATVIALTLLTAPAHAANTGPFTYVSNKATSTSPTQSVEQTCGEDRAVGTGGLMSVKGKNGRLTQIHLTDDADGNFDADNGVRTFGDVINGKQATIKVAGVCVGGNHAASLTYTHQTFSLPANGFGTQTGTLACPGGSEVIGGGAFLIDDDGLGNDRLIRSRPGGTGWDYGAFYSNNAHASSVDVDVVCIPVNDVAITTIARTVSLDSDDFKSATAKCPKGTNVASGGFDGGSGTFLVGSMPWDGKDGDHVPDDGWKSTTFSAGESFDMTSTALCVGED